MESIIMLQLETSSSSDYFTPKESFTPSSISRPIPPPINTKRNSLLSELAGNAVLHSTGNSVLYSKSLEPKFRKLEHKVSPLDKLNRTNSLEVIHSADKLKRMKYDYFEPFSANSKHQAYLSTFCPLGELSPIQPNKFDVSFGLQRTQTLPIVSQDKTKLLKSRLDKALLFVVDDEFFIRNVISEKLLAINSKVKIHEAETGDNFLEKFKVLLNDVISSDFALVFMDYSMPGISGKKTIKRIRRDEAYQELHHKIIIIAHTAEAGSTPDEMVQAGANAILKKGGGRHLEFIDLLYNLTNTAFL